MQSSCMRDALNPTTGVLVRERRATDKLGKSPDEGCLTVMQPQAQGHLQGASRSWKVQEGPSDRVSGGSMALPTPGIRTRWRMGTHPGSRRRPVLPSLPHTPGLSESERASPGCIAFVACGLPTSSLAPGDNEGTNSAAGILTHQPQPVWGVCTRAVCTRFRVRLTQSRESGYPKMETAGPKPPPLRSETCVSCGHFTLQVPLAVWVAHPQPGPALAGPARTWVHAAAQKTTLAAAVF